MGCPLTADDLALCDSVVIDLSPDATAFLLQFPIAAVMHPTAPVKVRDGDTGWRGTLLTSVPGRDSKVSGSSSQIETKLEPELLGGWGDTR